MKLESGKEVVELAGAKPFVAIGVPAFNEELSIARVVLEAQKYADRVVVCDDGSSDLTGEIALRLGADVVRHERNLGYGAAVQSLFRRARELDADVLVTLDTDGQHDPSEVSDVVKPIVEGKADVVVGSRFVDERSAYAMPWYRRAGVKFVTRLTNNGARHGASVVMSIVRLVVEERPLLFLGVPGVFSLLVGVLFGVWMLQIYAAEHRIVTNIALASIAFILIGFFAISTAITLYTIARLIQKSTNAR